MTKCKKNAIISAICLLASLGAGIAIVSRHKRKRPAKYSRKGANNYAHF